MDVNTKNTSVEKGEMELFDDLSKVWWNKTLIALITMNKVRVPFMEKALATSDTSKPVSEKLLLEVGCGGGILAEDLAKFGGTVHGIDPCSKLINIAKEHAALNPSLTNLTYFCSSIEDYALENSEKYDAVIVSEVLEHVEDKEMLLEASIKCLKPGGSVLITTLNKTTTSWLSSIVLVQEILNIIPRGAHDWNKFISPEDVSTLLEKYNCRTKKVAGMSFNFIYKRWSSTSSLNNWYCLHAVKNE